ncbi:MAG TPA: hypothetical protein VI612_00480 [Candidatus Nanoarchaeia archaeon]|nr:hypothetical protein [Candidatus Nanoarchaeia archaeon]
MTGHLQERVARDWSLILEGIRSYKGVVIPVTLQERKVPIPPPNPAQADGVFSHFYLELPLRDHSCATLGYVHRERRRRQGFKPHAPEVLEQLKHQTALRLEGLSGLSSVYFSSDLLGYDSASVTPWLCSQLKSPSLPAEIDIVHDPWITSLLSDAGSLSARLD